MRLIAGGPPVDAPMAMSRGGAGPSLREAGGATGVGGGENAPDMVPACARARRAVGEVHHAQLRHHAHLGEQLLLDVAQLGRDRARRLGHEVERAELERLEHVLARRVAGDDDAPASAAAPSSRRRKEKPSILGISRSSVITSGCS